VTDSLFRPSGDVFGWSLNVGMGWAPADVRRPEVLILSTQGGIRERDGTPLALGYHTGHWEVGLLMRAAAEELRAHRLMPFAGFCTDPCDGRTQGTVGMMDSLPYRRRSRRWYCSNDRRSVCPRPDHAAGSSGARMSCLRFTRRRLSVPRNGRNITGCRRGVGIERAALRARSFRPADLDRHGSALRTRD
jgi:hypothetical protein